MPIGGLKEKVLAARRNKIKDIILPQFNKRDLDKLDEQVTQGVNFHLVGSIEEVLALAFPQDEKREVMQPILTPPNTSNADMISKAVALAVREALRER